MCAEGDSILKAYETIVRPIKDKRAVNPIKQLIQAAKAVHLLVEPISGDDDCLCLPYKDSDGKWHHEPDCKVVALSNALPAAEAYESERQERERKVRRLCEILAEYGGYGSVAQALVRELLQP